MRECFSKTLKLRMRRFAPFDGYFGWAHQLAEKRDQLFVLEGCSLPAILRPVDAQLSHDAASDVEVV
jgi:hypothetical protein